MQESNSFKCSYRDVGSLISYHSWFIGELQHWNMIESRYEYNAHMFFGSEQPM